MNNVLGNSFRNYLTYSDESEVIPLLSEEPFQVMLVGAVYDRALFLESTKYARSQTAPTAHWSFLGEAP
jgi:hypothetical protein